MDLPFVAEAADELAAAVSWYEERREGYGRLFAQEVRGVVSRAAKYQASGSLVESLARSHDVRRFALVRFPYAVVTGLVSGERAVIAVAHTSREPGYWHARV